MHFATVKYQIFLNVNLEDLELITGEKFLISLHLNNSY